jgi:hypothetical protein
LRFNGLKALDPSFRWGDGGYSRFPHDFFNALTDPDLLDVVDQPWPTHREQLFPPTTALSLFMAPTLNADASWQATMGRPIGHHLAVADHGARRGVAQQHHEQDVRDPGRAGVAAQDEAADAVEVGSGMNPVPCA